MPPPYRSFRRGFPRLRNITCSGRGPLDVLAGIQQHAVGLDDVITVAEILTCIVVRVAFDCAPLEGLMMPFALAHVIRDGAVDYRRGLGSASRRLCGPPVIVPCPQRPTP